MSDNRILLVECIPHYQSNIITESTDDALGPKNIILSGIVMQADSRNRNGRTYPMNEMSNAVARMTQQIKENGGVFGELDHPADRLTVNLKEVSHAIVGLHMDGSNVMGKMKLLETPMGDLARGLVRSGIRFGVSSRGTGIVTESIVSNFDLQTIDLVATPSAQGAYPVPVTEALKSTKQGEELIEMLHVHRDDPIAQKYIAEGVAKFAKNLLAEFSSRK